MIFLKKTRSSLLFFVIVLVFYAANGHVFQEICNKACSYNCVFVTGSEGGTCFGERCICIPTTTPPPPKSSTGSKAMASSPKPAAAASAAAAATTKPKERWSTFILLTIQEMCQKACESNCYYHGGVVGGSCIKGRCVCRVPPIPPKPPPTRPPKKEYISSLNPIVILKTPQGHLDFVKFKYW